MALTEGLITIFQRLGRPPADLGSGVFWAMVDNIVQVWKQVFPYELIEFAVTVEEQRENDRGVAESLKHGIGNQYAVPAGLYKMLKSFFPELRLTDRKFIHEFTNRYPFFKTTKAKL